jgi:hypothetical protein
MMSEHYEPRFELEYSSEDSHYRGFAGGYLKKTTMFGKATLVPPLVMFIEETIWVRPPSPTDPMAKMIPQTNPTQMIDQLNLKIDKFIRSSDRNTLTAAEFHDEFGTWCDAKSSSDILLVELDRESKTSFSVTFYLRGEPPRQITSDLSHLDLMVEILADTYGSKVQAAP